MLIESGNGLRASFSRWIGVQGPLIGMQGPLIGVQGPLIGV